MVTPTLPDRRTATSRPVRRQPPQVPYRGLFREARYEDGQPYGQDSGEDEEDDDR